MAVALVGSVTALTRIASGTTVTAASWAQTPTAGNLLVAAISRAGSTATANPTSTGAAGWTRLLPASFVTNIGVGSATACDCLADFWYKVAAGGDTIPVFTMTLAGGTSVFAMAGAIYELSGANTTTPLDVSGTESSGGTSGSISAVTTTTSANVSATGEFAISIAVRERAAIDPAITYTSGWTNGYNDGSTGGAVSSVAHTGTAYLAGPASGSTASNVMTLSTTATTAFSAGAIVVIAAAPPVVSGPPLGNSISQPAGARVSLLRTGLVMATLLPAVAAGPPPTSGPPVTPLQQPAGIHKVLPPRGRVHHRAGTWQGTGPPVPALHSPVQAGDASPSGGQHLKLPSRGTAIRGGTGVRNGTGPPAKPLAQPVRAAWPARVGGGTVRHLAGVYATLGPPVRPLTSPVRAPVSARPRGGTVTRRAGTLATSGPKVTPLTRPVRAATRVLPPRGRVAFTQAAAVQAAVNVIAVYGAIPAAVRAALPPVPAGRHTASPVKAGTAPPASGPPVRPLPGPVRAQPARTRGGTVRSSPGTRNGTGPAVTPLHHPVRAAQAMTPALTGRAMAIGPLPAPAGFIPVSGPPIPPRAQPWQAAARPLPARGKTSGRAGIRAGQGPAVRPLTAPVRARTPLPPPGRVYGAVKPAAHLPAPASGPQITPRAAPWRSVLPPLRVHGFALAMGALPVPVVVPVSGPPLRPLTSPVRAPVPQRASGGRVTSRAGTFAGTGPPVPPLSQPAGVLVTYLRAGHVQSSPRAPAAAVTWEAAAALGGQGTLAVSGVTLGYAASLSGSGALTAAAVTITPTPFTGLWDTSPLAPRWQAALLPSRWQAAPLAPRWKVTAVQYEPVSALSVEYIPVLWNSELAGTEIDPTGATAGQPQLTVQFAVPVSSGNPLMPAEPVTWYLAVWLTGTNIRGFVANCAVGPTGGSPAGLVQLTAGTAYDIWGRILGTPEQPVKYAGTLPVY